LYRMNSLRLGFNRAVGGGWWVHYAIHLHEPHISLFCYGPKGSHEA